MWCHPRVPPRPSIGNLTPAEAGAFLAEARRTLGPSLFLVGADPTRNGECLRRAYAGADGLMADFQLNLLTRLNRECGADFGVDNFRHGVRICEEPVWVEVHLFARRPATFRLGGRTITFAAEESGRTDISHKYAPDTLRALAVRNGWSPVELWLDPDESFGPHLFQG